MKALIVEPSRMIRNIFAALFSKNNVQSTGVTTGTDALAELERGGVDFLCFSIQLSDMTGLDFFARAKERGLIGQHPSVILSSAQETISAPALALGVTECFSKKEPAIFEDFVTRWVANTTAKLSGRVLVIEDSAAQAAHLARLLNGFGLTTAQVANGEAALALMAQQSFDLVLVDYVLESAMTGLNVIRQIRALPGRAGKTPLLAISGFDDTARRIEMLRSGANDFVPKPVVAEELQVRVGNMIQLRQTQDFLEEQHRILYEMAIRDRLTSVYNRYFITEHTPKLIQELRAAGRPLSLVIVGLDHFKRINDAHGYAMGDTVLTAVATTINDHAGENALVARIDGDQFMAVLPGCDTFEAIGTAEKLLERIEELSPSGLAITASIGVAPLYADDNYDSLFNRADVSMLAAKRAGRNQVIAAE